MAKSRIIDVRFPVGGQDRRGRYAQKTPPFYSPRGINVRSVGPLEKRGRGGSRPGMAKYVDNDFGTNITGMASVTYIDAEGDRQQDLAVIADGSLNIVSGSSVTEATAYLTIAGDKVTIDGDYVVFGSSVAETNPLGDSNAFQMCEWNGKLYIADSTLKKYDPLTGVVSTVSGAPANQPLVIVFQERLLVAGADHIFYMCAQADETDWNAGADMGNQGRAIMGYVGDSGQIGEKIRAVHGWRDRAAIFGCMDSVWVLQGNMAGDYQKRNISPFSGIISPQAMAVTPNGLVVFLTRAGLYAWQIGSTSEPEPFSAKVVPDELLDVDTTTIDVLMQYDHRSRGIHLFLTPHSGVGSHWWLDLEHRAMWPVKFNENHQPVSTAVLPREGFSNVLLGCKDGYIRVFDDDETDDDGEEIHSHLLLGPFHVAGTDGYDGLVHEIISALADGSGDVNYALYSGDTAEESVDAADAALTAAVDEQY